MRLGAVASAVSERGRFAFRIALGGSFAAGAPFVLASKADFCEERGSRQDLSRLPMQSAATSPNQLRIFEVQNGLVISETGQQDADDFAADFQGLRHFADRAGAALELGGSIYASLHEPDFTFMYLLPLEAGAQPAKALGAMLGHDASNTELLVALRQRNQ
jgi:hypothetical protein